MRENNSLTREVEEVARRMIWSEVEDDIKAEAIRFAAIFVAVNREMVSELNDLVEEIGEDAS